MKKEKPDATGSCDRQEAGSAAASSLMQFFKQQNWKVVSFFPHSKCRKDPKKK